MSKFREQQPMVATHGAAAHEQRDEAMSQAQAAEFGRRMMEQVVNTDKRVELLEKHAANMQER